MFSKLKQRSWIKIEVALGRSTLKWFQGLRETLDGTDFRHSSWQCKESYRCYCHGPLAPLAMRDSGASTVLTRYEFTRLRSLRQSEGTITRGPVQHKRWTCPCILVVQYGTSTMDALTVRRFPNIWQKVINKGETILKVHKCCSFVNKVTSQISNCCHYFLSKPSMLCLMPTHCTLRASDFAHCG